MSAAESWALIAELGLTKKGYRKLYKKARKQKGRIFASYEDVTEYRKQHCTPKDGIYQQPYEVGISLQAALDHQISRILGIPLDETVMSREEQAQLQEKIVVLVSRGYKIKFYFKYGAGKLLMKKLINLTHASMKL